jgi:hypothetical protein
MSMFTVQINGYIAKAGAWIRYGTLINVRPGGRRTSIAGISISINGKNVLACQVINRYDLATVANDD